jgi:hypothetical protein
MATFPFIISRWLRLVKKDNKTRLINKAEPVPRRKTTSRPTFGQLVRLKMTAIYLGYRIIRAAAFYGRLVAGRGAKKPSSVNLVSSCFRCLKSETQFETVETISRAAAFFETCFTGAAAGAGFTSPFLITFILGIIAFPPCSV